MHGRKRRRRGEEEERGGESRRQRKRRRRRRSQKEEQEQHAVGEEGWGDRKYVRRTSRIEEEPARTDRMSAKKT